MDFKSLKIVVELSHNINSHRIMLDLFYYPLLDLEKMLYFTIVGKIK
jgi:hypothetical protein